MEGNLLGGNWSLGLHGLVEGGTDALAAFALALQQSLTVLVHVQLGDDDVAGDDADGNGLAVNLLARQALDVDDVLAAVDLRDLALTALVRSTDNLDLVAAADGHAADVVLATELLAHGRAHDHSALVARRGKVGLAGLSARRADV